MPRPAVKPDTSNTSYVTVVDKRTRKSKSMTVYGMTPAQLVTFIRKAVEEKQQRESEAA